MLLNNGKRNKTWQLTKKISIIFDKYRQDNSFTMITQFGERIRELRIERGLLLRQLASKLDVDTSIISKVERGNRQLKRTEIPLLAKILQIDKLELETLWLADQVMQLVKDEPTANQVLKTKSKKIKQFQ